MSQSPEVDVKPKFNLVVNFEGQTVTLKVKANTPFKKIFDAVTARFTKEAGTFRFGFNGVRIKPDDTPGGLGIEEDEVVDAFLEQYGGNLDLLNSCLVMTDYSDAWHLLTSI